ncbi:hypothetical protein M407DRAFT_232499 [Tulasnella calospora MUT 4182]|uniref:Exonuclease domain-containing protein n=1 Tax=Tulasnella calospora MUT 4182 TaxID=1051891 RepID=A0A0C3M1T2_9AGAM|nr:hypothetical protein M407DRAFT_232499 [Tulasnella calospora MUT 4182]
MQAQASSGMDFNNSVPQHSNFSNGQAEHRSTPRLNRNAKPYTPPKSLLEDLSDREGNFLALSNHQHGYAWGNVDRSLTQALTQHGAAPPKPGRDYPSIKRFLSSNVRAGADVLGLAGQSVDPPMREFSRRLRKYILNATELVQNDFLVPTYMESEVGDVGYLGPYSIPPVWDDQWKEIKRSKEPATYHVKRVLAIDCEMVLAGEEQILAQVCLVDWFSERIVYFHYVAPPPHKVITDYVTEKSGITAATLCGATKTLQQVQQDLLLLIHQSNTILVGHGLHTDLKVLKLSHATVVDTSLIFDPPFGRKPGPPTLWQRPKLKDLVKVHLGDRDFQNGCHSPAADALACIKLTKTKLSCGPKFGGGGWRIFKARLAKQGLFPVPPGPADVFGMVGTPGAVWQPPSRLPSASLFSFASTTNKRIEIKAPNASTTAEYSPQIVATMLDASSMDVDDGEEDMVISDSDLDVRESCQPSTIPDEDGGDTEPEGEYTLSIPSRVSYRSCPTPASTSFLGMFSPSAMSFTI